MAWVRDIGSLHNFIGYVVLRAPDRFPREDYLSEEEQMNLDRAFAALREGVALVERDFPGADVGRGLNSVLDKSLACYRAGDDVAGAHLLQDFERLIFKE
jgi:hypothetical protein